MGPMRLKQRGIVAVLVALSLLALLVMAGLALDTGRLVLEKSRLQSVVDAAALAAAKQLSDTPNLVAADGAADRAIVLSASQYPELKKLLADGVVVFEKPEYSRTLAPFVPGATAVEAEFVRVRAENFSMRTSFSVLVGLNKMPMRASAVAGPSAPIENPCGLFPVGVCAVEGASAPDWGFVHEAIYTLTLVDDSEEGAPPEPGVEEEGKWDVGTGLYHYLSLWDARGGHDLGDQMAAGGGCAALGQTIDSIDPKGGLVVGKAVGMNTRFGDYPGSFKKSTYPPDYIVRTRTGGTVPDMPLAWDRKTRQITYDGQPLAEVTDMDLYRHSNYEGDYAAVPPRYTNPTDGEAQRRVVVIPVLDCTDLLHGAGRPAKVAGFGCFFLLQPMEHTGQGVIFGEYVESCQASGNPGTAEFGPYKIVLHNDPSSADS